MSELTSLKSTVGSSTDISEERKFLARLTNNIHSVEVTQNKKLFKFVQINNADSILESIFLAKEDAYLYNIETYVFAGEYISTTDIALKRILLYAKTLPNRRPSYK